MPMLNPIKRRDKKHQAHVDRPVVITGKFDLHYEDVVQHNRLVIVAFIATGLLAVAAFMPAAVYRSTADSQRVILQAEDGKVTNPAQVTIVHGDTDSGGYIEFGKE
jgi:hypothetical protein